MLTTCVRPLQKKVSSQRRLCFQTQAEVDVRSCCLSEIKQTEEKYTETLESIEKVLKYMFLTWTIVFLFLICFFESTEQCDA